MEDKKKKKEFFSSLLEQINETKKKQQVIVYENIDYNIKWNVNKIIPLKKSINAQGQILARKTHNPRRAKAICFRSSMILL